MSKPFPIFIALTLFFSACQSSNPPDRPESILSATIPASSPVPLPQDTPTASISQIHTQTPAADLILPPNGEYLDHLNVGEAGIYALTIDDGYGRLPFDSILAELRSRNIQATFFLVADASIKLGLERMQTLVEDGHTIAYHSNTHDDLELMEDWNAFDWLNDYYAWEQAMRLLLGDDLYAQLVRPYARAPYGLFNRPFLGMTKEIGLIPVGWSRDQGDLNIGLTVRPGDIFLMHVRVLDAATLPALLDEIDLTPVSLDDLFAAWQTED